MRTLGLPVAADPPRAGRGRTTTGTYPRRAPTVGGGDGSAAGFGCGAWSGRRTAISSARSRPANTPPGCVPPPNGTRVGLRQRRGVGGEGRRDAAVFQGLQRERPRLYGTGPHVGEGLVAGHVGLPKKVGRDGPPHRGAPATCSKRGGGPKHVTHEQVFCADARVGGVGGVASVVRNGERRVRTGIDSRPDRPRPWRRRATPGRTSNPGRRWTGRRPGSRRPAPG